MPIVSYITKVFHFQSLPLLGLPAFITMRLTDFLCVCVCGCVFGPFMFYEKCNIIKQVSKNAHSVKILVRSLCYFL
jgi:H+/Cl- antiporter ClcA